MSQPSRARSRLLWLAGIAGVAAVLAIGVSAPVWAQSFNLDLGEAGGSTTARMIQLVALITVLSAAPTLLVMVTSFTRIVVVMSFLRTAMGIQQTPPGQVLIGLALFLTLFIMQPTLERAYNDGIVPLINEEVDQIQGMTAVARPFHDFMLLHVRERDLALFFELAQVPPVATAGETPYRVLIPAFIISELRRAFEIGFLLFLPFLIIDMVVASVLMSMGMMMLPPTMISIPFKLIFFVLVDGWYLLAGSLVQGFEPPSNAILPTEPLIFEETDAGPPGGGG